MQFAAYDLIGALFSPSDPWPVPRPTDKLFARICGMIRSRSARSLTVAAFATIPISPENFAAVSAVRRAPIPARLRSLHRTDLIVGFLLESLMAAVAVANDEATCEIYPRSSLHMHGQMSSI
jgi:hypothetical protein